MTDRYQAWHARLVETSREAGREFLVLYGATPAYSTWHTDTFLDWIAERMERDGPAD